MARQPRSIAPKTPVSPDQMRRMGIFQFFRETAAELKRVTWPTRDETMRLTGVVIAISAAVGGILFAADTVFGLILDRFILR